MPSTPSQKSIDVCRSAPTIVMWWTPWLWSFCIGASPSARRASTCTRCAAGSPTARARRGSGRRARCAAGRGSRRRAPGPRSAPRASSTLTGSGGSCLTPGRLRRTRMWPLTAGANAAHDLADGRGEDVDAAHDQHVVGAADAAHARAGAAAAGTGRSGRATWSRVRKRSSGAARCRRWVSTSSPEAPSASSTGGAGLGVDQLRVDEPARARGACRPAPRTRPRARRRCRRCPSPR